jgi:O-antigen/teichoic acid export membrane protein
MVSGVGSAVIGIVFWAAAAHLAPAATVGRMSAEIAAVTLLAVLAQLSFGSIFERFLPVAGDQTRALVKRAYAMCLSAALVLAISYVSLGLGHSFLPASFWWRAVFVISVMLWTIFALQDAVLIGLRATRWVPVENIFYSLTKLALLPLLILMTARQGIFVAWMIPVVFIIVVVNWYLFKKRIPKHEVVNVSEEKLPSIRELITLTGAQYATLLVNVLTTSIVTLIVIDRLGAVAGAHYYISAQLAGGSGLVVASIMSSFIVEASSEPGGMHHFARVALWTSVSLLGPIVVIGVIIAPQILDVFGGSYAAQGTTLMRMLLLTVPASFVVSFFTAFSWLDKRVWWFAVRQLASAAVFFSLLLTMIGRFGIVSIGVASLIESGVEAFFFLPMLIRRYRLAVRSTVL